MQQSTIQSRVYGLDVFRAIAILLVLYSHGKILSGNVFEFIPSIPLIDGVDLFFVLSGFLIGGILISSFEQTKRFTIKEVFVFWKRRWFRTLPTYYLVLFINIVFAKLHWISGDISQFNFRFFFFTQNLYKGFYEFFWESWSLSVEEWFYLILPILIIILSRFLTVRTTLLVSIGFLVIVPFLYRLSISDMKVDWFWWDVEFRKVVVTRLDAISYGVFGAFVKFYYPVFWFKIRYYALAIGIVLFILIITIPQDTESLYLKIYYFNLIAMVSWCFLPLADSIKHFKNKIIGNTFTFFSKISYSLYLINLSIVISLITTNFKLEYKYQHVIAYYSYWVIVVIFAWLLYKFYELPMTNLRDKN
jgi:peptidoglycan/LPS O-acetylase OafA/YrhL